MPVHIIRVSATAHKTPKDEFIEIDEQDVIAEGLIAKAIYVNDEIKNGTEIKDSSEAKFLIEKANEKRIAIKAEYEKLGVAINPLVVIQLPNAKVATKIHAENALKDLGFTVENGRVGIWLSEEKKNLENLKALNSPVCFLIMKQAIATGWDCPRAKILVKLREGCAEDFDIQTIGRIRRQPERKHYNNEILDNCYIWTIDEKFKAGLFAEGAVERTRLFLKNEKSIRDFLLQKQTKGITYIGMGTNEICLAFIEHLKEKYNLKLCKNYESNKAKLESKGYIIGEQIIRNTVSGKFVEQKDLENTNLNQHLKISVLANTHIHGIDLQHSTFAIHEAAFVSYDDVKTILRNLFYEKGDENYRFLNLDLNSIYAFIINNEHLLKEEFRELYSKKVMQDVSKDAEYEDWKIPTEDVVKYSSKNKDTSEFKRNVYQVYNRQMVTTDNGIRSQCEILFEKYCENSQNVRWFYKNGDVGEEYFRIIYTNGVEQLYFYPDYIVMTNDEKIFIIEAKGGESYGKDKNIDKNVKNKFEALKQYAKEKNVNWGFVRDKDESLYINNTQWQDDMSSDAWKNIENIVN